LEEQESPEFSMVELPNASSHPKAMVVELADATLAEFAVLRSVGLLELAFIAKPLRRGVKRRDVFNRFRRGFFRVCTGPQLI